ncbi:precorrin-2 C(20)-methyltransferase [Alkalibacter rhizosphaerae]|uniref:Precorrin-2 C(20)-methyltransferase n=1 Tax=Alkalibacter rhizosphaerae TaxID=2815577 RepID=A0A974XFM9_9FIRM|nr:precorrin-2 C(20)-methyltransferase [Alkalibacter rhizosphaerae]QSX08826.1 precorrin-2 C(20)-methyltransferase [Alkalibacter rhizosphaerae]
MTTGTLYGIGVGPGDPELLTAKAIRILQRIDVIVSPITKMGKKSKANQIAGEYINPAVETMLLEFPMVDLRKNEEMLHGVWESNAKAIVSVLKEGKDVAFITLGDPMIYSTYAYMLPFFNKLGVHPVTVPGIPSFCASAAHLNIPIARGNETFGVLTDIREDRDLEEALQIYDNLIIMKASASVDVINRVVQRQGLEGRMFSVTDCGGENEQVTYGSLEEKIGYFTLILLKKNEEWERQEEA